MNKTVFFNLFFFSILAVNTNISAQSADIILTNGKIFTSDINHLFVQALAIKGDKIIAAGSNEEIKKLADTKSQRIDLGGVKPLCLALMTHMHMLVQAIQHTVLS